MVPEVVRAILAPSTPPTWLDASSGRSPALPGLSSKGYPGTNRSVKQVQASSGLLYYVFARYDPDNLLLFRRTERCWNASWSRAAWAGRSSGPRTER
jgi:hypothetical protein